MAELVDAVVLGTIRKCPVQVQVLLPVRELEFLKKKYTNIRIAHFNNGIG